MDSEFLLLLLSETLLAGFLNIFVGLVPHSQPTGPLVSGLKDFGSNLVANSAGNAGFYQVLRLVTPLSSSSAVDCLP